MQTSIDLDVLRERTKLEPVQLAIDGSSFIPVLAGLAKDAQIRGTVIVAFQDGALSSPEDKHNIAERFESLYQEQSKISHRFDYFFVENFLSYQRRPPTFAQLRRWRTSAPIVIDFRVIPVRTHACKTQSCCQTGRG